MLGSIKIRTKLIFLVVFLIAGIGYYIYYVNQIVDEVKIKGDIYNNIILQKDLIADILPPPEYIIESYLTVFQMTETKNLTEISGLKEKMVALQKDFKIRHQYWVDNLKEGRQRELITKESYGHAMDFYALYNTRFVGLIDSGEVEQAKTLLNTDLRSHYEAHRGKVDELVKLAVADAAQYEQTAEEIVTKDKRNVIIIGIVIAAVIALILFFIAGSILRSLRQISAVSLDLASGDGDLTIRLPDKSNDEIGQMSKNFNKFLTKLSDIMRNIRSSSRSVASETNSIKQSLMQISSSIEVLAHTSTTNAASIEELSSTNILVSENTQHLLQQAEQTVQLANEGGTAVRSTIDEMNRIKHVVNQGSENVQNLGAKAKQIDEIVIVINDIASQTNLLALNAAIEAARAGDAGRGFEVVAEEVRKLAEKSAESTKEIASMIKEIQSETRSAIEKMREVDAEVAVGVQVADRTGELLENIVTKMAELKNLIHMIATSTREQAMATEDMAKQTEAITTNVEENSRAIDSSAQAITEMSKIADELSKIVGMFKV